MPTFISINRIVRFRQCVFQTHWRTVWFYFEGYTRKYSMLRRVYSHLCGLGRRSGEPSPNDTEEKRHTRALLGFCFCFQLELSPHLVLIKTVYIFSVGGS